MWDVKLLPLINKRLLDCLYANFLAHLHASRLFIYMIYTWVFEHSKQPQKTAVSILRLCICPRRKVIEMVDVPENGIGEMNVSHGSKNKYGRVDSELLDDLGDAFIQHNHQVERKRITGKFVIPCSIFASLNHVLLGYGKLYLSFCCNTYAVNKLSKSALGKPSISIGTQPWSARWIASLSPNKVNPLSSTLPLLASSLICSIEVVNRNIHNSFFCYYYCHDFDMICLL